MFFLLWLSETRKSEFDEINGWTSKLRVYRFMTLSNKNRSGNLINSRETTTETQSVLTLATASNTADKNVNLKIHHLEVIKQKTSSVCKESQCLFTTSTDVAQLCLGLVVADVSQHTWRCLGLLSSEYRISLTLCWIIMLMIIQQSHSVELEILWFNFEIMNDN